MGSTYTKHTEDADGLGRSWWMDAEISPATVKSGALLLALDPYTRPQAGTIRDPKGTPVDDGQGGGGSGETPPPIVLDPVTWDYGTGIGAVDSAKWLAGVLGATSYNLTGVSTPKDMQIVTDVAADSYSGIADAWSVETGQSGKVSGVVQRADKHENRVYIGAYCEDDPDNGNMRDGWYLNVLAVADSVKLVKVVNGSEEQIGAEASISFPNGASVMRYEFQPGLGATFWLSGATKPSTPNFPATGDDFPASAVGHVGFHINSGGGGEAFTFVCSAPVFDPLDGPVLAEPPSDAAISSDLTKPYAPTAVKNLAWAVDFEDTFTGSAIDSAKWIDHEPFYSAPGYGGDVWHPLPVTSEVLAVSGGQVRLSAVLGDDLPGGAHWQGVELLTRGKYATPQLTAGKKVFIECRCKSDSAKGFWPALWTEGFNDLHVANDDHTGWPTLGENDLFEWFNLKGGIGYPYWSVHYPADIASDPPGTFLNDQHQFQVTPGRRLDLLDSFHTWGMLVEDSAMKMYVDGELLFTYTVGQTYAGHTYTQAIHDLFRGPQFLRLTASAGGYAATGWTEGEYESGDLVVDYVRVFKI